MKDNNRKETPWFSHDANAKDDPKIMLLIDQLGLEGYGIFWVLVETLREQPELKYPLALIPILAKRYGTTAQKMDVVVRQFGLFEFSDNELFFSMSLMKRILHLREKQDRRSAAALKANITRWERVRQGRLLENGINQENLSIQSPDGIRTESKRIINGIRTESDFIHNIRKDNIRKDNIDISEDKSSSISLSNFCESDTENVAGSSSDLFQVPENSEETQRGDEVALLPKHYKQIQDFWNDTISRTSATFSKVAAISEVRKKKIQVRWREFAKVGNPMEVCRTIFENACNSKFLQGDSRNGWKASFDWIFHNEQNWVKVYEGRFNDKGGGGGGTNWNSFTKDMSEIGDYFDSKMKAEYGEQDRNSESPDEP